jgi:hypothetical protein
MMPTFQADETQRRSFMVSMHDECPDVMGSTLEHI